VLNIWVETNMQSNISNYGIDQAIKDLITTEYCDCWNMMMYTKKYIYRNTYTKPPTEGDASPYGLCEVMTQDKFRCPTGSNAVANVFIESMRRLSGYEYDFPSRLNRKTVFATLDKKIADDYGHSLSVKETYIMLLPNNAQMFAYIPKSSVAQELFQGADSIVIMSSIAGQLHRFVEDYTVNFSEYLKMIKANKITADTVRMQTVYEFTSYMSKQFDSGGMKTEKGYNLLIATLTKLLSNLKNADEGLFHELTKIFQNYTNQFDEISFGDFDKIKKNELTIVADKYILIPQSLMRSLIKFMTTK
jgi:hypothetical protein